MAKQANRTRDDYIAIALRPAIAGTVGALVFAYGNADPMHGALAGGTVGACVEWYMLYASGRKTQKNASATHLSNFALSMEQGGYIKRGSILDLFRSPKPTTIKSNSHQMPLPPLEIAEFMFVSAVPVGSAIYNVQLPDSFVRRFLRYADRNRKRGVGLSERNWKHRIQCEPLWYDAMIVLLQYAQYLRGVQIVLATANNYKRLAYDWYTTYAILRVVENDKVTSSGSIRN